MIGCENVGAVSDHNVVTDRDFISSFKVATAIDKNVVAHKNMFTVGVGASLIQSKIFSAALQAREHTAHVG